MRPHIYTNMLLVCGTRSCSLTAGHELWIWYLKDQKTITYRSAQRVCRTWDPVLLHRTHFTVSLRDGPPHQLVRRVETTICSSSDHGRMCGEILGRLGGHTEPRILQERWTRRWDKSVVYVCAYLKNCYYYYSCNTLLWCAFIRDKWWHCRNILVQCVDPCCEEGSSPAQLHVY